MTISASETLIRYLGPSEAYFWLSNQNSWKHFVVAAQITGETTTASWRTALDAVQRRHPLLGVCIDADDSGAPFFRLLPELRIALRIVPEDAGWEDEMETELSTPFPVEDALLVRAVLLHKAHRATILLTVHHSIADGLSVAFIVRDILEALSGKPLEALPVPQPQEDLCPPPTIQSTELGSEEPKAPAPPSAPGTPLKRDRSLLRVRGLRLPAELSDRLRERSRREAWSANRSPRVRWQRYSPRMERGAGSCCLTRQQQDDFGPRRRLRLVDHLSRRLVQSEVAYPVLGDCTFGP
jgi:hypothetical protein